MTRKTTVLTIVLTLILLLLAGSGEEAAARCGDGGVDCPAVAQAAAAGMAAAPAEEKAADGIRVQEGVTVYPGRTLPGMDEEPAPEAAHYVDAHNPEWRATFGTEAGRQLIAPRPAPFRAPAAPPLELDGYWRSLATTGSTRVVAMADAPDGRLFAAIAGDGLRVYAPDGNGVYGWSAIHAGARGGLASDNVSDLAVFGNELWVATGDAGISLLNLESNSWRTFNSSNSDLPADQVNSLTTVRPPTGFSYIWVGTQGGGAARYGFSLFAQGYVWIVVNSGNGLPDDGVRDIAVVFSGSETRAYFSTDNGLARRVGSSWTYYHGGNTGDCAVELSDKLAVDHDNNVWIATSIIVPARPPAEEGIAAPEAGVELASGVCRHRQGAIFSFWDHYDRHSPGLPTNAVGGFSVDHAGRTWMAFRDYETGDGGAAVYDQGTWLIFETPADPLPGSNVHSVHAAGESVWFGDGNSASFATYTPNWLRFAGAQPVRTILLEADDAWVGRAKQLAHHDGNGWNYYYPPLFLAEITSIARDTDGLLYVGTSGEGIYPFSGGSFGPPLTTADGLPSDDVRALTVDGDGNLWAATGGGLALQADGYWLRFTAATSELLADDVRGLTAGAQGDLWIATGAGISILDVSGNGAGEWGQQTMADGLPTNEIRALATDPDGHIWAATAAGVAEWDPVAATWTVHDSGSGALPGDDVLSIAADPVGRIWAGTGSGLAHYEANAWQQFHVTGTTLDADRVVAVASDGERLWAGAANAVSVRGVLTGPIGFYTPVITAFSPTQGAPGTTVIISGQHFDDRGPEYNTVKFCCFSTSKLPHHEAHVVSATTTELVVKVPLMAATGPISVEAHNLKSEWSAEDFELAPVITDVGSGCVALGDRVEIYGAGFSDGFGAPYVKIGDGPERLADYADPNVIRQFVRPDDTPGAIRIRLTNGNSATSSETISISRPLVAGAAVQQAIEGQQMIWGKRTLVQIKLVSNGGLCPAKVDGGTMEWVKTDNSTQPAAFAYFPNSAGLNVGFIEQVVSLDTTVNFVADFGYQGIFPLWQLAGGQIVLKNGPVELFTISMDTIALSFVNVPDQVQFSLMGIMPQNSTYSGGPTFWDMAWESMADVARVYPQRDIGWRWGSGSWIHKVNAWHSYGMVNLDGDDYSTVRNLVHDYVDPGGNNQAMAMVHQDLYPQAPPGFDNPPTGKATMGHPTAVTFNFEDDAAPIFLQEAIHSLDWVKSSSANHDGGNEHHSRYDELETDDVCTLGLTFRQALIDQLGGTRRVVRLRWAEDPYEFGLFGCDGANMPRSAMSYVPNDDNSNTFLEPLDYNYTRFETQKAAQQRRQAQAILAPYVTAPALRLSGSISLTGAVAIRLSYVEAAGQQLSVPAPESDYEVQIRSGAGDLLYSHPFPALFEGTHHDEAAGDPVPAAFNLRVPFPAGAARAEIRHDGALLWSAEVSPGAPTVAFTAPTGGSYDADGMIPVTWSGTDPDGGALQYRLEYSADGGSTWILLAPYLTGESYEWQPGHVPAGGNARLRLQVSDGFNTGTALSAPFTLNPHPPWATILTPDEGAVFPEGKTITLAGTSTTSAGPHTGSFRWSRADEPEELGTTDAVSYTLGAPGTYTFDFEVTADGMSDTESVSVTVVADYDHDGMPNEWELQHRLNPLNPADALQDPDGDGLFNTEEHRYGTNPRVADSDGDGDDDGDEVDAGVDPTIDTQTVPDGPVLNVGAEALGYEAVAAQPALDATDLWVTNGGPGVLSWQASSSVNWITVAPASGDAPTEVTVNASAAGLAPGTYNGEITFSASAAGSPRVIPVTLVVSEGAPGNMVLLPIVRE